MNILYFGDIYGKPGRKAIASVLGDLKNKYQPDFIIGNVENLAGGRGINRKTYREMADLGFHCFTSGNHIWDNKEVYGLFEGQVPLLRPANFPSTVTLPCPGRGYRYIESNGKRLFVMNLMGRVFMDMLDCPFHAAERILTEEKPACPIFVDMHADATSEKHAMGWFLTGRVAAVVGSHSHVQTADERILPGGTAYITDVGLSGALDSIIGLKPAPIIQRYLTRRPQSNQNARENPIVCAVVVRISDSGKTESIERIRIHPPSALVTEEDLE